MDVSEDDLERLVAFVDGLHAPRTRDQLAAYVLPGLGRIVDQRRPPGESDLALLRAVRGPVERALARAERPRPEHRSPEDPQPEGPGRYLTRREREVLALVAAGGTNVAIAHRLGCSPRTVAKHLEHAYDALGVRSRAAAVARLTAG